MHKITPTELLGRLSSLGDLARDLDCVPWAGRTMAFWWDHLHPLQSIWVCIHLSNPHLPTSRYYKWGENISAGLAGGTMAGPLVVWGESTSVVVAPITHAMEMNMVWESATNSYSAGPLGSIDALPVNYTVETMLFLGPNSAAGCAPFKCGPNAAVRGFGQAVRTYTGKDTGFPAGGYAADPTLQNLGYCASPLCHPVHEALRSPALTLSRPFPLLSPSTPTCLLVPNLRPFHLPLHTIEPFSRQACGLGNCGDVLMWT